MAFSADLSRADEPEDRVISALVTCPLLATNTSRITLPSMPRRRAMVGYFGLG